MVRIKFLCTCFDFNVGNGKQGGHPCDVNTVVVIKTYVRCISVVTCTSKQVYEQHRSTPVCITSVTASQLIRATLYAELKRPHCVCCVQLQECSVCADEQCTCSGWLALDSGITIQMMLRLFRAALVVKEQCSTAAWPRATWILLWETVTSSACTQTAGGTGLRGLLWKCKRMQITSYPI